jgi:hypothetical protein
MAARRHAAGARAAPTALLLPLLLLAAAAAAPLASARPQQPASANPYANVNWSGCDHGFCPPLDLAVERDFYAAAQRGDVAALRALLDGPHAKPLSAASGARAALNLTRNIVPDDSGHARVIDVAVWAAVRAGKPEAVRFLFVRAPTARQPDEDGHLVELAADVGDEALLRLLVEDEDPSASPRFSKGGLDMPIGPSALAHAALKGHVGAMRVLIARDTERVRREVAAAGRLTRPPLDLKAGMGAASRSGKLEAIEAMVAAGGMAAPHHPATGRKSVYDWQGEFVEEALGGAAHEARAPWRRALVPLRPPSAEALAAANAKVLAAERGGGGAKHAPASSSSSSSSSASPRGATGSLEAALRLLLEGGNYSVPWSSAQGLVASAARAGDPGALSCLFEQETVGGDADELAEAAQRALGVAAEEGQPAVVAWVLERHAPAAKRACGTALRRAIMYDHPSAAEAVLTAGGGVCGDAPVTAAAARQPSFQDAGWLGAVLGAARRGANDVLEALLAAKVAAVGADKTAALLGALHTARSAGDDPDDEGSDGSAKRPPPAQRADRDPLAAAAARGDARAVRALLPVASGLCASCAAVEAARGGHLELLALLTKGEEEEEEGGGKAGSKPRRGVAAAVLEQESSGGATDGLRCLAQALDQGQWGAIEWLSREHAKGKHLLAYFMPAIAQHADVGNMERVVDVLERAIVVPADQGEEEEAEDGAAEGGGGGGGGGGGDAKDEPKKKKRKRRAPRLLPGLNPEEIAYVRDQVHSASVSAALKGQPGMLATLQGSRLARALWAEERRQLARQKREEEEAARMKEQEREYMERKRAEEEEAEKEKDEL